VRAALGHAKGAEAEAGGIRRCAGVVEGLAHGAEGVGQCPGAGAIAEHLRQRRDASGGRGGGMSL
jgi:hypothetical protein